MRRLLFVFAMILLPAGLAAADGLDAKRAKVALPAPQSSVAVTVERGVRVWRPLGTDGGIEGAIAVPVNLTPPGGAAYVVPLSGGGGGVFGGFDGFSPRHGSHGDRGMKVWRGQGFAPRQPAVFWGHGRGSKRLIFSGRVTKRVAWTGHGHGHAFGGKPRGVGGKHR